MAWNALDIAISSPQLATLAILTFLITCRYIAQFVEKRVSSQRDRFPPGPKGLPIVGNAFDMPALSDWPWLKYHEWSKVYGRSIAYIVLRHKFAGHERCSSEI